MTVSALIAMLERVPGDLPVMVPNEDWDEFIEPRDIEATGVANCVKWVRIA
jgi:hypothetical protein